MLERGRLGARRLARRRRDARAGRRGRRAGARAARARAGERAALAGVRRRAGRRHGPRRRLPRLRHAAARARPRRGRGTSSASSRCASARAGGRAAAGLRGARGASRRWRRRCAWRSRSRTTTRSSRARARSRRWSTACSRAGVRACVRTRRSSDARARWTPSASCVAAGAWSGVAGRRRPSARSRARCCACATRPGPGCCDRVAALRGRLPRPARRRPLRTSARRWRSAASTPRSPRSASTSCCATPPSSLPGDPRAGDRGGVRGPAPRDARQRAGRSAPIATDERIVWATGHYRNGILLAPADRRARRRRADRRAPPEPRVRARSASLPATEGAPA